MKRVFARVPVVPLMVVAAMAVGCASSATTNAGGSNVEYAGDGPWETTVIKVNGRSAVVPYKAVGGKAVAEGDIVLMPVSLARENRPKISIDLQIQGITVVGPQYRWPSKTVYYSIDPNLPNSERVKGAIDYWNGLNLLAFRPRDNQPNFLYFTAGTGSSSPVGMQGGRQDITLGSACGKGEVLHEVGHAVGLWHEHSRRDRDDWVMVDLTKVEPGKEREFYPRLFDGENQNSYDYCSIMHYPDNAFAIHPTDKTIIAKRPIPNGCHLGQREKLSDGDIAAVKAMYP